MLEKSELRPKKREIQEEKECKKEKERAREEKRKP